MTGKTQRVPEADPTPAGRSPATSQGAVGARILIIEARYYDKISAELLAGALAEVEAAGATCECVVVPGALEIPQALAQAIKAELIGSDQAQARFDGCVALGCVIRGETTHYETVCHNANHWLMHLAVTHAIPLGNGILTVENEAQAMARARGRRKGKGADAVRACLAVIALERVLAEEEVP